MSIGAQISSSQGQYLKSYIQIRKTEISMTYLIVPAIWLRCLELAATKILLKKQKMKNINKDLAKEKLQRKKT
jgi:hypothetical protein